MSWVKYSGVVGVRLWVLWDFVDFHQGYFGITACRLGVIEAVCCTQGLLCRCWGHLRLLRYPRSSRLW